VTSPDGEIAKLVRASGCGQVVAPGDAEKLSATIIAMADDRAGAEAMGMRARAMLDARFSREDAITRWIGVLTDVMSPQVSN
jgi:glycosyltransferase involved in cell wall biosynthesis